MDSSPVVMPPHVAGPLRLAPFRGLMLAPSRIGDPSSGRAFARPYRAVTSRLARWQAQGQLCWDETPALYLHEYTAGGLTIRGLVGALDVSRRATRPEDRAVLPHEGIYPDQADDLADRMTQMQLNPAPILLVHRATAEARATVLRLIESTPDHQFTDRQEQRHRIWTIRDDADLALIAAALAGSRALIADGHHRYGAYLRMQRRHPGGPTDYGLAMLVDQDDTPLFLGAIHRVLTGVTMDGLRSAAESTGATLVVTSSGQAIAALGGTSLVATDGEVWATLTLPVPPDRAPIEILHELVVPALPEGPRRIGYHHSADEALAHAIAGQAVAVLLPAPEVALVERIVEADRLLPEKATSFQPKPSLGVLMRSLRDE
jgi:uncharacterized protein (DUF1015 family)